MIKYFTYQFQMGKYTGYRLLSEKGIFASFKKIEYQGFKILYANSEIIHYQIDTQILRKLKLKKLNDSLKRNSIEERLSQLLEGSEEKEEREYKEYGEYYWTIYNYNKNDVDLVQNINSTFIEKRARDKYCAKKYKNKV